MFIELAIPDKRNISILYESVFLVSYVLAGVGIIFRKSWAFYLAYIVIALRFLTYLSPSLTLIIPSLPIALPSLLSVGGLIWSHQTLRRSLLLDENFPDEITHRFLNNLRNLRLAGAVLFIGSTLILLWPFYILQTTSDELGMGSSFLLLVLWIAGPLPIVCLCTAIFSHFQLRKTLG